MRHRNLIGAERGFLLIAGVTLILTALIGGAAILSVITTRRPVGGALERLDNNTATPQDMQALQGAGQDFVRSAQILRAGGSLIGSRGPISNPAGGAAGRITGQSAGVLGGAGLGATPTGAESALGGVVNRAIGGLTTRASQPALTRDNPSGGTPSQAGRSPAAPIGSGVGSPRPPVDFGAIGQLGQQSHEGRYGGKPSPTAGSLGDPTGTAPPSVIDPNYRGTSTTSTPGADQPPAGGPGYPPAGPGQEPYPPQPGGAGIGAGGCPPGQHKDQATGQCHSQ